jgi:hypothetical protein
MPGFENPSEDRARMCVSPQPRRKPFARGPVDERPDVGFIGRKRFPAKIGNHTDVPWIVRPRVAVTGRPVDIAGDLLDVGDLGSGRSSAIDEYLVGVDGYFDANQSTKLPSRGGRWRRPGNQCAPWETYSTCWFVVREAGSFRGSMVEGRLWVKAGTICVRPSPAIRPLRTGPMHPVAIRMTLGRRLAGWR